MKDEKVPKFGVLVRIDCQGSTANIGVIHMGQPYDFMADLEGVQADLSTLESSAALTKRQRKQLDALFWLLITDALPADATVTLINERFTIVLIDNRPDASWFNFRYAIDQMRQTATWADGIDSLEHQLLGDFELSLPPLAQAA